MEEEVVEIFYEQRKESLRILNTGGAFVAYLTNINTPICPLIGSTIKFGKKLGQGVAGIAFEIVVPGSSKKSYVAKQMVRVYGLELTKYLLDVPTIEIAAAYLLQKYGVPEKMTLSFNKTTSPVKSVLLPSYILDCRVLEDMSTKNLITGKKIIYQPGEAMMCYDDTYSEYAIGLLMAENTFRGRSINFHEIFAFATCSPSNDLSDLKQYIFSARIKTNLYELLSHCLWRNARNSVINKVDRIEAITSLLVQVLHAVAVMQESRIVHGDLHAQNVFIEQLTDDSMWNNTHLLSASHYEYRIGQTSIYVTGGKRCPLVAKIADYGTSCKYSPPRILNKEVIMNGYEKNGIPLIVNVYHPAYDILFFLNAIEPLCKDVPIFNALEDLVYKDGTIEKSFDVHYSRPVIKNLPRFDHVTAAKLLTSPRLFPYLSQPLPGEKVVLLGSTSETS